MPLDTNHLLETPLKAKLTLMALTFFKDSGFPKQNNAHCNTTKTAHFVTYFFLPVKAQSHCLWDVYLLSHGDVGTEWNLHVSGFLRYFPWMINQIWRLKSSCRHFKVFDTFLWDVLSSF